MELATQSAKAGSREPRLHPTTQHYDLPVELFEAFLDPYLKYTSGLFQSPSDTLDQAIRNMLDKHLSYAERKTHPAILEVGCGWGSLLKRLQEADFPYDYTAVNPSAVQNRFITDRIAKDLEANIKLGTFEQLPEDKRYDLIYFVGSFCHMRAKREILRKLERMLTPNGQVIIEDTFFISDKHYLDHGQRPETSFVQDEVFGFAEILGFPQFLNWATASGFVLEEVLEHSDSYKRTIEIWMERLVKLDPVRFPMVKSFCDYMQIAQRGWEYTIANYFVVLRKNIRLRKPRGDAHVSDRQV